MQGLRESRGGFSCSIWVKCTVTGNCSLEFECTMCTIKDIVRSFYYAYFPNFRIKQDTKTRSSRLPLLLINKKILYGTFNSIVKGVKERNHHHWSTFAWSIFIGDTLAISSENPRISIKPQAHYRDPRQWKPGVSDQISKGV